MITFFNTNIFNTKMCVLKNIRVKNGSQLNLLGLTGYIIGYNRLLYNLNSSNVINNNFIKNKSLVAYFLDSHKKIVNI